MSNSGSTSLNFGATPTDSVSLQIADTNILSTSLVDAWLVPAQTVAHTPDEHWVENVKVMAGNIVAGVGFTVYGVATLGKVSGDFNINWVWY